VIVKRCCYEVLCQTGFFLLLIGWCECVVALGFLSCGFLV